MLKTAEVLNNVAVAACNHAIVVIFVSIKLYFFPSAASRHSVVNIERQIILILSLSSKLRFCPISVQKRNKRKV